MIEISHIVTNGCSFTYCQGIEKPWVNGWPALLAKKLGVPVINLAVGGSGNDAIHRRTYEYFYKNKKLLGKPLYVIAFSHATRKEEFFKTYKGNKIEDFHGLDLSASGLDLISTLGIRQLPEHHEVAHIMNLSYNACERKKFLYWDSVINLFKAHNVPYVTGDYMPTFDDAVTEYMKTKYGEIYSNCMYDKNSVGLITDHVKDFKKLECGHDPMEAMPVVADLYYNKILENYGEVKPYTTDEKMFYKLKEYYDERAQRLQHFNEWIMHT